MADITITIKKRDKSKNRRSKNKDSQKPLLPTFHGQKGGRRRLKKQSGFIEFYDGTWIKSGASFADVGFVRSKPNIELSDYAAFINLISAKSTNEFKRLASLIEEFRTEFLEDGNFPYLLGAASVLKYHQITDSLTNPENRDWTNQGLKLSEAERAGNLSVYGYNEFVLGGGAGASKVTTILNYDAPNQVLPLTEKMEIILLPRLETVSSFSEYYNGAGVEQPRVNGTTYLIYDFPEPRYKKTSPLYLKSYGGSWDSLNVNFSSPSAYYGAKEAAANSGILGIPTGVASAGLGFPSPPATPYDIPGGQNKGKRLNINSSGASPQPEHYPVAIIRVGSNNFFVWI